MLLNSSSTCGAGEPSALSLCASISSRMARNCLISAQLPLGRVFFLRNCICSAYCPSWIGINSYLCELWIQLRELRNLFFCPHGSGMVMRQFSKSTGQQISKTVNNEVAISRTLIVCTSVHRVDLGTESSFMTPRQQPTWGGFSLTLWPAHPGMSSSVHISRCRCSPQHYHVWSSAYSTSSETTVSSHCIQK
jgi:hypothetical protein